MSLRRPVAAVDEVVIDHLARNVLTDDVVNNALKILRRRLTARMKPSRGEVEEMERRAKLLRTEIDNLVAAIATGSTNVGALVQALAERGENLARIEERIRAITTTPERTSSDLRP